MLAVDTCATSQPCARDRLVDAAIALFATRGFQAISLRDLAGCAGLQAGSLYYHIENKQSLLFELIEAALSDLLVMTRCRMKGASTPRERLGRFVQVFVSFTLREKDRLVLVCREFVSLNEDHRHQAAELQDSYRALLYGIIAEACGVTGPRDEKVQLVANAVIGMLYGQLQWNDMQLPEQRMATVLTDCALRMIESGKR